MTGLSQVLNLPNDIPVRRSKFNNRDFIVDGTPVKYGDIVFHVSGSSQSILKAERMVLNSMQRMSAIATKTNKYVKLLEGTNTKILIPVKLHLVFVVLPKNGPEIGWRREPPFAI
jgi:nicotinate-nucleotide pyrophosphorylase (carboxylating)